jgi:hypothetical protein
MNCLLTEAESTSSKAKCGANNVKRLPKIFNKKNY